LAADFSARFRKTIDSGTDSIAQDLTPAQRDKFHGKWEEVVACKLTLAKGKNLDRWLIVFHRSSDHLHTLDDLGMRKKTAAEVTAALQNTHGMILFSALPGGGLTTLINIALESADRYMRDFVSVEDADLSDPEIANVDPRRYDSTVGERPADILPTVSRTQPDVIVCRNMVDSQSAKMLCELALKDFLVLNSIGARDSLEALLRVLVMKVPPELVAGSVSTVIHGRLIRKLCTHCKTPYQPSSELLKKLGIPPERTENLYRAPQPQGETVCDSCDGIGYRGVIGIYEILHMNPDVQKILVSGKPTIDGLRKAARKAGMHTEIDNGKVLVARGITSVEELQRVSKK
jgi:type II secretory ATPase GspE/PulE/Tfp pilus assembly ATPase PilB-like protein